MRIEVGGMPHKPELLATAGTLDEVVRLIGAGANAIQIGEQKYGMRLPGEFLMADIRKAAAIAHAQSAKIYVSMNNVMHYDVVDDIHVYLEELQKLPVDAVIFGDPAVLMAAKRVGFKLPLHWNPEMIATNYGSVNYWAGKGATRVFAARELNLEQILELKQHVSIEVQVQVHGMTNIFHSKRRMVSNYRAHQGVEATARETALEQGLFLVETERRDGHFPVYEDLNGTHIMSSEDICLLENLAELMEGHIDSFKIDGLLKSMEYNEAVVHAYRQAIDTYAENPLDYNYNPLWLEPIERLQPVDRPLTFGFMYKEQVY